MIFLKNKVKHIGECDYCILINKMCLHLQKKSIKTCCVAYMEILKIEFMKNKFKNKLHEITLIDNSWHINMILCYGCNDNLKLNTFHTLLIKWNTIIEYLEVFDAQSNVQKQ